jgi:hypothetical protein
LFALLVLRRRLVYRGRKVNVAAPAAAALGDHHAYVWAIEIRDQGARFLVVDLRAWRHLDDQIVAALAVLVLAAPVFTALGAQHASIAQIEQRRIALVSFEHDVAAAAAVAAGGAAEWHKLLSAKRRTTITAVACDGFDSNLVYEMHGPLL